MSLRRAEMSLRRERMPLRREPMHLRSEPMPPAPIALMPGAIALFLRRKHAPVILGFNLLAWAGLFALPGAGAHRRGRLAAAASIRTRYDCGVTPRFAVAYASRERISS